MEVGHEKYGRRVEIDFETRSYMDLKKVGSAVYAEHSSTEVIVLCYGIDDREVKAWLPRNIADEAGWGHEFCTEDDRMPNDLYMAIMLGALVECHNNAFEYWIWLRIMVERFGWIAISDHQWRDSMAVACYMAMPAALDKLAHTLGFGGKDPEGTRLISKYSKLNLKTAKPIILAEDLKKFVAYCIYDVKLEQSVSDYLGDLPDDELEIWQMNRDINRRGLYMDLHGIAAAEAVVDKRAVELTAAFVKLTGIEPTKVAKVKDWLAANGIEVENLQKETLKDLLDPDSDTPVPQGPARKAIELRLQINKASAKKFAAMARQVGSDGRAREQTRYHGAGTGRDTAGGFGVLNLNRGFSKMKPEQLVRDISYENPAWLDCLYGDAMDAVAKAVRHFIMAKPDHRIISGDFSSIEAVGLACLAGEQWKIDAFDRGYPMYAVMGAKIHSIPESTALMLGDDAFKEKYPNERQDGKTGELAFGYQGALKAWLKFDNSGRHSDEKIIEVCRAWRRSHPNIVDYWYALEHTAIAAVLSPGKLKQHRTIGFQMVDEWLSMILPDGKRIWYYKPQLRSKMPKWHDPLLNDECADGTCGHRPKPVLSYMAVKTGQWRRVDTYGGKLTENATQATCRQILKPAMKRLQAAGYDIVLDVYDEIVAEVPDSFGSVEEFEELLIERPPFAETWPIRGEVWEGQRYKK